MNLNKLREDVCKTNLTDYYNDSIILLDSIIKGNSITKSDRDLLCVDFLDFLPKGTSVNVFDKYIYKEQR